MDGMPTRGREIGRAWKEWEPRIIAAVPDLRGGPSPLQTFLAVARGRLEDAALAGCSPDAICAAIVDAAEAGVTPRPGSIIPQPDGSATWTPRPADLSAMLGQCFPDIWLRGDVIRPGDMMKAQRGADGAVLSLEHQREGENREPFHMVWARAAVHGPQGWKRIILLSRDEAEDIAARLLRLPGPVGAEDLALYVAWLLVIEAAPLPDGYAPVRRLRRVTARIWRVA